MPKFKPVGVVCDGRLEWHLPDVSGAGYATACGLDDNDPAVGLEPVPEASKGQTITCTQ